MVKESGIRRFLKKIAPFQKPLERYVFPVVLALWPLWGAWSGVDVTDTTYSLGNYLYLGDGMWFFSTFLANRAGALLAWLPGGGGMLAMNVKTALLISVTALACYYCLQRLMPGWMIFLGELLAISLFWCPTVILYNTLSYVLLTFACLFLFRAVSGIPRKRVYYAAAGALLGINLFVRFSNALQVVLIFAVWLEEWWSHRKFADAAKDTGACIGGYACGAGVIFTWISVQYGASTYIDAILELFGIDGGYTFGEMLVSTWNAYEAVFVWILIMAACVIAGMIYFSMPMLREYRWVKRGLYCAGILILFRFFWGRGVFTVVYTDYWCMFNWAMMFLLVVIAQDVLGIFGGYGATTDERFLSALSLILVLMLPFGSNNYTFPILLDLFLIAPFGVWMFRRVWQEARRKERQFAWYSMTAALMAALLVQGVLFHANFSFRDGTDGTARSTQISQVPNAAGMYTTAENAAQLESMYTFLSENGLTNRTLLTFGGVPGLSYLFDMEPALSTTWVDLESYSEEQFEKEMTDLGGLAMTTHREQLPVIIMLVDESHPYDDESLAALKGGTQEDRKALILRTLLEEGGYETVYEVGDYIVKVSAGTY